MAPAAIASVPRPLKIQALAALRTRKLLNMLSKRKLAAYAERAVAANLTGRNQVWNNFHDSGCDAPPGHESSFFHVKKRGAPMSTKRERAASATLAPPAAGDFRACCVASRKSRQRAAMELS
jgi:hypothetical protein